MILKITKGGGFRGTLNYLLREQKLERGLEREANSRRETEEKGQERTRDEGHELSQNRVENGEVERGEKREMKAAEERQNGHKTSRSKEGLEKSEDRDSEERARIIGGNMSGRNARELAAEFKASRELKPKVGKAVYHASLSLPHSERLTDEKWLEVTDKLQREMGFERSQYVVIRHSDKDHDHVHVVASRIGMDGRVVSDSKDYARGERIVRAIEREYGLELQRSSHEVTRRAPTRGEYERAMRTGEPSIKMRLQEYVDRALEGAPTASQFLERLGHERVEVIPNLQSTGRVSGISFRVDGELMKGSDLGRGYSWGGLEKRGMTYEHERDHAALSRAKEQAAVGYQRTEWKRGQNERRQPAERAQRPEQRREHNAERRAVEERTLPATDRADRGDVGQTRDSRTVDRLAASGRGEVRQRSGADGVGREETAGRSRGTQPNDQERIIGAEDGTNHEPQRAERFVRGGRSAERRELERDEGSGRGVSVSSQTEHQRLRGDEDRHRGGQRARGERHHGPGEAGTRQNRAGEPEAEHHFERGEFAGHLHAGDHPGGSRGERGGDLRAQPRDGRSSQASDKRIPQQRDDRVHELAAVESSRMAAEVERGAAQDNRAGSGPRDQETAGVERERAGGSEAGPKSVRDERKAGQEISHDVSLSDGSTAIQNVQHMLGVENEKSDKGKELRVGVEAEPKQIERQRSPAGELSELEKVQRMLGIETERERQTREANTFRIDRNDPAQRVGIARGEQMVRVFEYRALEARDAQEAARQWPAISKASEEALRVTGEYRERTGLEPAAILTKEQRSFLNEHKHLVRDDEEKQKMKEAIEHALVAGESSRSKPLDYDSRIKQPERSVAEERQQERVIEKTREQTIERGGWGFGR